MFFLLTLHHFSPWKIIYKIFIKLLGIRFELCKTFFRSLNTEPDFTVAHIVQSLRPTYIYTTVKTVHCFKACPSTKRRYHTTKLHPSLTCCLYLMAEHCNDSGLATSSFRAPLMGWLAYLPVGRALQLLPLSNPVALYSEKWLYTSINQIQILSINMHSNLCLTVCFVRRLL